MEKEIKKETRTKIKKEREENIFKYDQGDVNEKLIQILGKDFKKYRDDLARAENYPQTKFIPDFPLTLYIELVNRCNFHCVMCYTKHHSESRAELSFEVLEKIFKESKENKLPSIVLGMGGEALLYKDIKKVFKMIKEAGLQDIFLGTNASLLNDDIIDFIVRNKITRLKISLDAATPQIFGKIRTIGSLEQIERNIEKLIACKKKYNSFLPIIRISFVVMDENFEEIQAFIDKWKDRADCIDFQRCIDFSYVDKSMEIDQEIIKNSFCSGPFFSLSIWADGHVTPFCTFYDLKLPLGNIYKESLKDIWNGEKLREIRERLISKKFNPICQKCLYARDKHLIDKIS